ncbi:hypothetical protein C1701_15315 [Actinoalloteichus sp. AHMU CJ021]|uniref:DddA-like double-stranded DNA deaminase toxin n=1 Tax=Actinoalloteichus sp. AHMU CJ021 TaxID=2072503 RepID=UPI000CA04600|nr:hypothetical protein C1701_15315 [Actinoalloteichus sp. AHMU CJ021]
MAPKAAATGWRPNTPRTRPAPTSAPPPATCSPNIPCATADAARHVETKLALRQAESGVTHTVVVLNNLMCEGRYGCTEAVAAILPRGFSMTVWEPGRSRPTIIGGKAT